MKLLIEHPRFADRELIVYTEDSFGGQRLLIDGRAVVPINDRYVIRDNEREMAILRLKKRFLDPIPLIEIDEDVVEPKVLPEPVKWYVYVPALLPLALIYGGLLGAFIGLIASTVNLGILRSQLRLSNKFNIVWLVTFSSAIIVYPMLAALVQYLAKSPIYPR